MPMVRYRIETFDHCMKQRVETVHYCKRSSFHVGVNLCATRQMIKYHRDLKNMLYPPAQVPGGCTNKLQSTGVDTQWRQVTQNEAQDWAHVYEFPSIL